MPKGLYIQCVAPDYEDLHGYTPWYVAHEDPKKLTQAVLQQKFDEYAKEQNIDIFNEQADIAMFMDWMEKQPGYQIMFSGPERCVLLDVDGKSLQ